MQNQKLLSVFEKVMTKAKDTFHEFPWENKWAYGQWLRQTFYYVENSTRLVALTGARFPTNRNDMHRRFMQHCQEEMGHEVLPVRDIKALGLEFDNLYVYPESKALYQSQHFFVERLDPIAFYGYLLFLEGLAVHHARHAIDRAKKAHGEKAIGFLKLHADEDEDHLVKAFKTLENISDQDANYICENLEHSCYFYLGFMEKIMKSMKQDEVQKHSA
jgi:hypothetical protein